MVGWAFLEGHSSPRSIRVDLDGVGRARDRAGIPECQALCWGLRCEGGQCWWGVRARLEGVDRAWSIVFWLVKCSQPSIFSMRDRQWPPCGVGSLALTRAHSACKIQAVARVIRRDMAQAGRCLVCTCIWG